MNNHTMKKKRRRVIALLTREKIEFLDRLGMDSLFSTGSKLSRVDVISALLDAAMLLGISAEGVQNKPELVQKILDAAYSQPNRRKYPRLKKELMVGFRKVDSMEQYKNGSTDNISMGGFRIDVAFLGKPLLINQAIEITINEPQEKGEPIKTIGRVAWIKEKEDKHSHEIGVMLTYIRKEDKERFMKYLSGEVDAKSTYFDKESNCESERTQS